MAPTQTYTLREHLRSYPDGLIGLAECTGLHIATLYAFANAETQSLPVRTAQRIADALNGRPSLEGERMTLAWLAARWTEQKETQR